VFSASCSLIFMKGERVQGSINADISWQTYFSDVVTKSSFSIKAADSQETPGVSAFSSPFQMHGWYLQGYILCRVFSSLYF